MGSAQLCRACGLGLRPGARFCDGCGAAAGADSDFAEYKQVTVMFTDEVGSMRIASALVPEPLGEIMGELMQRGAAVVQRYGGTVDKFTRDGLMAMFGAPAALEDHALRAWRAAIAIQDEMQRLVEPLLDRAADGDLDVARAAIERLAAVPTEPGFVLHELPSLRLRALVARRQGDDAGCRELMQRYRANAAAAGFDPLVDARE
jgi:Adenylate and Guanylate cyclase catalytic domain